MKVVSLIRHREPYPWDAVEHGILAAGVSLHAAGDWDRDSAVVTWNAYGSARAMGEACRAAGGTWVVLENGYIGRDKGYVAAGLGGWAGIEPIPDWISRVDGQRFERLGATVHPWRMSGGEYILVLGQRGGSYSVLAMDNGWPEMILRQLREMTDAKLVYRPHPGRAIVPSNLPANCVIDSSTPLVDLLGKALATVVWTSNGATESILHGVPVYYCGPSIAVKELAAAGIASIFGMRFCPVREPILHQLAWRQFRADEWCSGWAWKVMTGRVPPV